MSTPPIFEGMTAFLRETLQILNDAAPYLLFGFLLAGALEVFLKRYRHVTAVLTKPGARPVFLAALLGAPLPLCSCSVLPAALTLRHQGASKGTTASFLISVPETDVTSIAVTYALLGPVMAIARPLAAVFTAITTGLVVDRVEPTRNRLVAEEGTVASGESRKPGAGTSPDGTGLAPPRHWFRRMLHFGFVEMFDDIILQLVLGIVIAGAIVAWSQGFGLERILGGPVTTYFIMLVLGVPIYVCATASTPLALGFIAGGVGPGAALVFLLVGPATNIANLIVLSRHFGRGALVLYVSTLALISVAMGLLLDVVLSDHVAIGIRALHSVSERSSAVTPTAFAWIFLVLLALSIQRKWRLRKKRGSPR